MIVEESMLIDHLRVCDREGEGPNMVVIRRWICVSLDWKRKLSER